MNAAIPFQMLPEGLRSSGAAPSDIARCEREASIVFPDDYKDFLVRSDGYNGPAGRGYLSLWSIGELSPDNSGYDLGDDMGGIFYIGTNGGPTAYGVDWSSGEPVYISVPFVPAERPEVRILGKTFAEFVSAIAAGEGW